MEVKVKLKKLSKLIRNNKAFSKEVKDLRKRLDSQIRHNADSRSNFLSTEDKMLNAQAEAANWKKKWSVAIAKQVSLEQSIKEPPEKRLSQVARDFGISRQEAAEIISGKVMEKASPNQKVTQNEYIFLKGYLSGRKVVDR